MREIVDIFPRSARPLVLDALADTRVVFVAGARQVGKSTLARETARRGHPAQELSLDNRLTREAALTDPEGFVAGLSGPVFIDEIQRAPDLLLAIKDVVDRDLTPGRFLLTGSANVLTARTVKDALTGRMETIPLWPLAQSEIRGSDTTAYHYRQRDDEVDLVLESRAGEIVAIEVKAAASVGRKDLRAVEKLRDSRGECFKAGVVICTGAQTIPLGERLWAVPISGLWA
jgi:predicted AAA+ superfamily ATPase